MTSHSRPVVVGVDGSAQSDPAVRWAAHEAASLGVPLQLMHAYTYATFGSSAGYAVGAEVEPIHHRELAQASVDGALARQVAAWPGGPEVVGAVCEATAVAALLQASQTAAVVVVGSRLLGPIGATLLGSTGAAVAARAACPVVVVRATSGRPAADGPVVVGVDLGALSGLTLGYAFDHASRYAVPLRAVLAWPFGSRLPIRGTAADREDFRARGQVMLAEALAGWQEKYPDVTVERVLVDGHPVQALVAESVTAHMLVVGAYGRTARLSSLLGSVSQGVLHHAACPVAVVHPEGPAQVG